MKIETKLSVNQQAFFMMNNKVCEAKIIGIKVMVGNDAYPYITYEIDNNPAGTKYTTTGFNESEIFSHKQALLETL